MLRKDIFNAKKNGSGIRKSDKSESSNNSKTVQPVVSEFKRFTVRAVPTVDHDNLRETNSKDSSSRAVSGGRRRSSGTRDPDGTVFREARGRGDIKKPNFNIKVNSDGYAWWYVDGLSNDRSYAISIIGFIGSVFSPWYGWAGRKNPHDHCCINVALYGKGWRWTMTERGEGALKTSENQFKVGPSSFNWIDNCLVVDVDEIATPHLDRVRGTIKIIPDYITNIEVPLKTDGTHVWRPFSPNSKIEVDIQKKGWQWSGHGYFDANFGTKALEKDFSYWTWARLPTPDGSIALYDANLRNGETLSVGLNFSKDGTIKQIDTPSIVRIPRSLWGVKRETRADDGYKPEQVKHMLDTPFYTRSAIRTKLFGNETVGIHEALDLNRFSLKILKPMLALRIPRRK